MKQRRSTQVFSLAFLDCICCALGAVILIFVLTMWSSPERNASVLSRIQEAISRISAEIVGHEKASGEFRASLASKNAAIEDTKAKADNANKSVKDLQYQLSLMLQDRSALKDELEKLLGDKKAIPTQDEPAPIPIPNEVRRQYLSGFNFDGSYMTILVRASGSMVGYTVDEAIARNALSDAEKRKSEKWRRVVRSVQWIIANLRADQNYQVVLFNREAKSIIPEREDEWFKPNDRDTTRAVLERLAEYTPQGGADLEAAFTTVREKFGSTDDLVLITDGLPTRSASLGGDSVTTDSDRERYFRAAIKQAPRGTPVNVLLFPMSGDPAAAFLYWQLAMQNKGSLISPAASWPDI